MRMMRWGLILLAAAILPSCGPDHRRVWVTINNNGTEGASLWIEAHYESGLWSSVEKHDTTVAPGASVSYRFDRDLLHRLELRIYRTSDFYKLFEDSWDHGDLDDLDFVVTVTVAP